MTPQHLVRDLIERNAVRVGFIADTDDKRWLEDMPKGLMVTEFEIAHECPAMPILIPVEMILSEFMMDMKPQVGVLVYIGQCVRCKAAFFGIRDGNPETPPADAKKVVHPKGPHRRK